MPPEGIEAHGLMDGKPTLWTNVGYVNPSWGTDYENIQLYYSTKAGGENMASYGFSLSSGSSLVDRNAYFLRYDYTIGGSSLSFKFNHVDYRYINVGSNTFSMDINGVIDMGEVAAVYLVAGVYHRTTLAAAQSPNWSPFNYSSDDKEIFFEFVLGTRLPVGDEDYLTFDLNNRDQFMSYNGDNVAFDLSYNLVTDTDLTFRLTSSSRMSALFAGTGDIGTQSIYLGLITHWE